MTTADSPPATSDNPIASLPEPLQELPGPPWQDLHAPEERVRPRAIRFDKWTPFMCLPAALAVLFSLIAIGCGSGAPTTAGSALVASSATVATTNPASPGPVALSEFKVQTAATAVAAGKVTFQISNAGKVQHELLVFRSNLAPSAYPLKDGNIDEEGTGITKVSDGDNLDPGTTQTRTVDLNQPGTYLFVCNLPGHFKAGMYQVVTVK
jgi:uncharacterized cupredoxin-like copper-binding protein